jgi:Fic family protein/predicted small lipoprotein YifL
VARQIPEQELTPIERQIAASPQGVSISELEAALASVGVFINRRTLLRRLTVLIEQNRIIATGVLKGRLYLPPGAKPADFSSNQESAIPLSAAGNEIRRYVSQPIQRREPVGYHRDFLLAYHENGPYFDDATRDHLHRIGRAHQGAMPAGTIARQVLGRLLIDLSWASSYLEGNTYSLLETERLISFGQAAEGKDALETQMILNHKQAIEFLVESTEEVGFNRYTILNLHATLSDNLLPDPEACGRLRQLAVGIGGSVYTPLATPQLLDEYFQRFLDTAASITDPFEQSFFSLVHLSYLQPFEDVNKRVARLTANIPLFKNNLCPLSFIDVPKRSYVEGILGVYEMNRIELLRDIYVWGYERSVKRYLSAREELGEPDPFRLEYRKQLADVVREIVCNAIAVANEDDYILEWATANLPETNRSKFIDMVKREVAALHEGNIARFRIKPSEFNVWRENQLRNH